MRRRRLLGTIPEGLNPRLRGQRRRRVSTLAPALSAGVRRRRLLDQRITHHGKCAITEPIRQNHLTDRQANARLRPMINDVTSALYPGVFPDLIDGSILRLEPGERLLKL